MDLQYVVAKKKFLIIILFILIKVFINIKIVLQNEYLLIKFF